MAKEFGRCTELPVYEICKRSVMMRSFNGIKQIKDVGPAEFLGLVQKAEYVVTNSFHGTVFSVNFHKNFFAVMSMQGARHCP